ncbi:MAG: hypothetical protein P8Z31_02010 [Gammaproteobacteria bacterium]
MSSRKFYTPRFVKMANVTLGNRLNPLVTGREGVDGQINADKRHRDLVIDKERERSHYFDGKLLKARDLLRDQNYLDARLRQAGRAFGAGIIEGLETHLDDGWISVSEGSGITPSGLVIELRDHTLRAPVNDAALRQELNRGRYGYLNSGLYMVLLSWHEETSDAIAEVYPRKASVQPQAQPDSYQQGVRLEILPLQKGAPVNDELMARAQLAEEFLDYGAEFPGMPADSLPVGLLAVRNNLPLWLDSTLVRRDYRDEREAHAARLRHRRQYDDLLGDLVRERHGSNSFELNRYFRRIPAMGPLPKSFVDPVNQAFTGFPDHYELSLVPVREDDIPFLQTQTEHLPPIDLRSRKSEKIQILVPLGESDYEKLVAALEGERAPAKSLSISREAILSNTLSELSLTRTDTAILPFERMISTRITPRLVADLIRIARPAWVTAFSKIRDRTGLWYMREFQLSAIQAPQVLPISKGFPEAVQPEVPVEPTEPTPTEPTPTEPTPTEPTPQPAEPTIFEIIAARGSINKDTQIAVAELREIIDKHQDLLNKLFGFFDNTYDRLFWRAMMQIQDHAAFMERLLQGLSDRIPAFKIVSEIGLDLGLDRTEISRWTAVAEAVGDV